MRARGLKPVMAGHSLVFPRSRPMRARGLKLDLPGLFWDRHLVAPHAGAWIETTDTGTYHAIGTVAPHAGAWIETTDIIK